MPRAPTMLSRDPIKIVGETQESTASSLNKARDNLSKLKQIEYKKATAETKKIRNLQPVVEHDSTQTTEQSLAASLSFYIQEHRPSTMKRIAVPFPVDAEDSLGPNEIKRNATDFPSRKHSSSLSGRNWGISTDGNQSLSMDDQLFYNIPPEYM